MARKEAQCRTIVALLGNRSKSNQRTIRASASLKEAGINQQRTTAGERVRRTKARQARRLKELEKENGRLRRLVTELSLEKQVLKEAASGNF